MQKLCQCWRFNSVLPLCVGSLVNNNTVDFIRPSDWGFACLSHTWNIGQADAWTAAMRPSPAHKEPMRIEAFSL